MADNWAASMVARSAAKLDAVKAGLTVEHSAYERAAPKGKQRAVKTAAWMVAQKARC